jgi:hypothetical protein
MTVAGAAAGELLRILGLVALGIVAGLLPAAVFAWAGGLLPRRARTTGAPERVPVVPPPAPAPPPLAALVAPSAPPPPPLPTPAELPDLPEPPDPAEPDPPSAGWPVRRHRELYDVEYAAQLNRLDELRLRISTRMAASTAATRGNGRRPAPNDAPPPAADDEP